MANKFEDLEKVVAQLQKEVTRLSGKLKLSHPTHHEPRANETRQTKRKFASFSTSTVTTLISVCTRRYVFKGSYISCD